MRVLPLALRMLIFASGAALVAVLATAIASIRETGAGLTWLLILVVGLSELVPVRVFPEIRQERTSFTLGSLGLAFLLAWPGPDWAVLAAALHGLVVTCRARTPWYQTLYSMSVVTCAMWVAGCLLRLVDPVGPVYLHLLMLAISAASYVLINHAGVLLAVAWQTHQPFFALWRRQFAWVSLQQWLLTVTGISLGYAFAWAGWYALFLASPLVLLRSIYLRYTRSQSEHTAELEHFANQLITTLAAVVDARDAYTFGHSAQVARYAVALGREMGYSPAELERLRVGALLHDIGKVGVPESILFKPGKLEPWEYQVMKQHAVIGYQIVGRIGRLQYAADIIHQHHEWFNGKGYPQGLRGEQILRDARVVGVADALESLMSDRPYRAGRTLVEALTELRLWGGTQFDPEVLGALERVVDREGASFFVNSAAVVAAEHADMAAAATIRQAAASAAQ